MEKKSNQNFNWKLQAEECTKCICYLERKIYVLTYVSLINFFFKDLTVVYVKS